VRIYLGNCWSRLSGSTPELEQSLAVAHDGYWYNERYKAGLWDGKTHFLKIPSLVFPSGLLGFVEDHFRSTGEAYEIIDERKKVEIDESAWPETFSGLLHGIDLRPYQEEAIATAMCCERGCFEMATGSGKTEVAAGIIRLLSRPTLFLVHTLDLLRQTSARFSLRLGRPVGRFGGGEEVDSDVVVATVQTISEWLKRSPRFAKAWLSRFEVLFLDESHHASASTWYRIAMSTPRAFFRYGLSGTVLRRDDVSNMKMMAALGGLIYELPAHELIAQGHLSKIKVNLISNPTIVPASASTKWATVYREGVVRSDWRNRKIVEIARQASSSGGRTLILVRQIEHGEILRQLLGEDVVFLSGSDSSLMRGEMVEEFEGGKRSILIASTIFDEGVDIPSINTLIIAAGGKSEIRTIQRIGRGLRKKEGGEALEVYDFLDRGKFLARHSALRKETYEKERFL